MERGRRLHRLIFWCGLNCAMEPTSPNKGIQPTTAECVDTPMEEPVYEEMRPVALENGRRMEELIYEEMRPVDVQNGGRTHTKKRPQCISWIVEEIPFDFKHFSLVITMKTLLGLFVYFGLATIGSSLECEVCSGLSTSCNGSTMPCEVGKDTCTITMTEHSLVGVPMQMIAKACGSLDTCKQGPKYMHLGSGKAFRSSVTCCVGDTCQTATAQLPPVITEPNGKWCPACYALSSTDCSAETVDCRGPEDHCLELEVRVTYENVITNTAQKGCISKSFCDDLRREEVSFSGGSAAVIKAECKPATTKA